MKKVFNVIFALILTCSICSLTACNSDKIEGDWHEEATGYTWIFEDGAISVYSTDTTPFGTGTYTKDGSSYNISLTQGSVNHTCTGKIENGILTLTYSYSTRTLTRKTD